jgi:pyrroline-5-carboxylate reductase
MKMKTLGFIGGGRVTRILLTGFKNANISFEKIFVFETNEVVLNNLKADFPQIEISVSNAEPAASSDLVFVALHPPVLMQTLQTVREYFRANSLVVSLAPKITIDVLKNVLPANINIARMNPNAGTFVNKGFNPVCFADNVNKSVSDEFIGLFDKLGKIPVVVENQIEAYAVISAMGHTYFWFQLQQLKELAVSFGLSEKEAQEAISAMLWGTTETLFNSGLSFEDVTNLVPVKPMGEHETAIKEFYNTNLNAIFQKIKP